MIDRYIGGFKNNKKKENLISNIQMDKLKNDQQTGNVKSIIKKSAQAIKGSIFHDRKQ